MSFGTGLRNWLRGTPAAYPLDPAEWRETLALPVLAGLNGEERARLQALTARFIAAKQFNPARGYVLSERVVQRIGAQASLLVLNLGLRWYRGWREIILYPAAFVPARSYTDAAGVVHETRYPHLGEAWRGGPLIFSAAEVAGAGARRGANVVIHEFAHKLDMLDGDANGLPPLHAAMRVADWAAAFAAAYGDFCRRVERGEETAIDPYAAETPAEFFAVSSEVFFEQPAILAEIYPPVFAQLRAFYRQDPLVRLPAETIS